MKISDLRRDYARAALDEASTSLDPIEQFGRWFDDAQRADLLEVNAMTLATADAGGRPSARIVLLKGVDAGGFLFFTDYRSRKGTELTQNPRAALVFHWAELERQVRICGAVERLSSEDSASYFHSRPEGSRIGAWASHQSAPLKTRLELEAKVEELTASFASGEIPLPPHWGGFRLMPDEMEFWQGRPSRLHDRITYQRTSDGGWLRGRLSP
ncbi:MAG: pyridoxamine 5'-phosphate oxidase [Gemmatimonadales bacterium]